MLSTFDSYVNKTCSECGCDVRIIASIEDPAVIQKILAHLDNTGSSAVALYYKVLPSTLRWFLKMHQIHRYLFPVSKPLRFKAPWNRSPLESKPGCKSRACQCIAGSYSGGLLISCSGITCRKGFGQSFIKGFRQMR